MTSRPAGLVAFLFTDLEGSTALWNRYPRDMDAVYGRHDAILRDACDAHGGIVYKVIGDAIQAAFARPVDALTAAVAAQQALLAESWPVPARIRVRMALHVCPVEPDASGDYRTPGLNRAGRLLATCRGGHLLASAPFVERLLEPLPAGVQFRDLGEHRFRDLSPQSVFAVMAPGLSANEPLLPSTEPHRHNLVPPPTPLIGRELEVAAVQRMLRHPAARVVTLIGPGGIGKTRLAQAVAAAMVESWDDGVWFVPLASITDRALLLSAIARELGVVESVDQTLDDALVAHLRPRRTLLVLDNLEQVSHAATVLAPVIAACPRLVLLTTSRSPLGVSGEREFPVPPLAVPAATGRRGSSGDDAESDAVRLFVERARAIRPTFSLAGENGAAVAAICQRLDGLPLAIELAAARTRSLTPSQLLVRLERGLALLTGGPEDRPDRQRTLRGTIDWSHDLLEERERTLFARLAVFSGGATIEMAEAVCADDVIDPEVMMDGLDRLVEQSLVQLTHPAGGGRFQMLQTIRDYALEQLDQRGETIATRDRLVTAMHSLAEAAEPELTGAAQGAWLDRLDGERDNLRAAFAHLEAVGPATTHLSLVASLWRFWWIRGYLTEGRARLALALAAPDLPVSADAIRAQALDGAGALAEAQGAIDEAAALHTAALDIRRTLGDRLGCARSLENLGLIELHDRGNLDRAAEFHEAALTLYRAGGDPPGVASALANLGDTALARQDHDTAEHLYAEALAMSQTRHDTRSVAATLTSLGALAYFRGESSRAIALYDEALISWRDLGDAPGVALTLGNLGAARFMAGDFARAATAYGESLAISQDVGDRQGVAFALTNQGRLARAQGDLPDARRLLVEAFAIAAEIGDPPRTAECLEGLAGVLLDDGEATAAVELAAMAEGVRDQVGFPLPSVHQPAWERDLAALRHNLGPAAFNEAWESGANRSLDHLASHLRSIVGPQRPRTSARPEPQAFRPGASGARSGPPEAPAPGNHGQR